MSIIRIIILTLTFLVCSVKGQFNSRVIIRLSGTNDLLLGLVSEFSRGVESLTQPYPIRFPSSSLGCEAWSNTFSNNPKNNFIALIERGNCSFLLKTIQAQKAGAVAALIVSTDESILPMSSSMEDFVKYDVRKESIIPAIMVPRSIKQAIQRLEEDVKVSVEPYGAKFWDLTMIVIIAVATGVVGLGAYYSSDKERNKYFSLLRGHNHSLHVFRDRQEVQEIDAVMAWSFVIVASIGLLTMFYFVQYLFKCILFVFMIASINGLTTIGTHILEYCYPSLLLRPSVYRGQCLGEEFNIKWSDVIALIPSLCISIHWYWFRFEEWAWTLQNLMCVGLLMVLQRTLQIPNLRIASILLGTAFIYDIFWVFVSPYFFTRSVMVAVATYTHENSRDTLPVMLKFPKINDPLHGPMILGLGDIALPGLLISYLLRFDYWNRSISLSCFEKGYFLPALIGYAVGLLLTDINLIIMQQGQPALLFLVPSTLGLVLFLAYRRGDLHRLWEGPNSAVANAKVRNGEQE